MNINIFYTMKDFEGENENINQEEKGIYKIMKTWTTLKDNLGDKYMLHCNKTLHKRLTSQIYKELPKKNRKKKVNNPV